MSDRWHRRCHDPARSRPYKRRQVFLPRVAAARYIVLVVVRATIVPAATGAPLHCAWYLHAARAFVVTISSAQGAWSHAPTPLLAQGLRIQVHDTLSTVPVSRARQPMTAIIWFVAIGLLLVSLA